MLRQVRKIIRFRKWSGRFHCETDEGKILIASAVTARVFSRSHYLLEFGWSTPFLRRIDRFLGKFAQNENLSVDHLTLIEVIPFFSRKEYPYHILSCPDPLVHQADWALGIGDGGRAYFSFSDGRKGKTLTPVSDPTDEEIISYILDME